MKHHSPGESSLENPLLRLTILESRPGFSKYGLEPLVENLTWIVSARGMGNERADIAYGQRAESYTYLGLTSDAGGLLFSCPIPLEEQAVFSVSSHELVFKGPTPFRVAFSSKGLVTLFESYGAEFAKGQVAKPIFGWNSWDPFNASVTEEAVLRNMDFITRHKNLREKVTHIIVDDGWQTDWGHWSANGKFPSGMQGLSDRIHQAGFKSGIWVAPLCAEPCAPLYQLSPECFLKDAEGHPYLMHQGLVRSFYCLDVSVPKTREFLKGLFRQFKDWSFDYVKMDFLFNHAECLTQPGCRASDPTWSTNRHIVEMLRIAREELGPRVHLLACNTPFELGGEHFDEVRLTNDIGTFWQNVRYCYHAQAARYFMSGRWFAVDPDFAVVRVPEKTWKGGDYPFHVEVAWERNQKPVGWRRGPFWSEEEMRLGLALVIISGGSVILGDDLPGLNEEGLRLVDLALAYGGKSAGKPLDFSGHRVLPCLWENRELYIAVNPGETPISLNIPFEAAESLELFTLEMVTPSGKVTIPPHGARIYPKRVMGNPVS